MLLAYLDVLIALAYPLAACWRALRGGPMPIGWRRPELERGIYRAAGIDPAAGMPWNVYALALLLFNAAGVLAVYALQRVQALLPLNPQHFAGVAPDSAFNTAVSFATNTNWQGYAGESTMSYLTQMLGLAVQNFLSAATGIAVAFALIRGFARRAAEASAISGSTLPAARSTSCCRSLVDLLAPSIRLPAGVTAEPFTRMPQEPRTASTGRHQTQSLPWARSPRRRRSRCSAPTAADSSTPTRRTL